MLSEQPSPRCPDPATAREWIEGLPYEDLDTLVTTIYVAWLTGTRVSQIAKAFNLPADGVLRIVEYYHRLIEGVRRGVNAGTSAEDIARDLEVDLPKVAAVVQFLPKIAPITPNPAPLEID